jgi:hypothetical protein
MSTTAKEPEMFPDEDDLFPAYEPARELCARSADGVDVRLVWSPADESVTVIVTDARTGIEFEVPVGDADPMDVFRHPYYHAGRHGYGELLAA